ncbi:MAG: ribonuclease III [Oscillospiraceae bacterium]|nr:ribonuclease III [Oscillospiraceae bacterium]MBQ9250999.1 ribonuclease III [Oscillospiraceae bacterium]
MGDLEKKIGYTFRNRRLLETALTHSSYANERHGVDCESYERLEFLGDSILGFTTAEFLYAHEPSLPEGSMTRLRAELVCESSLHKAALALDLGRYMRLGKGEERSGGRERPSILADMVEAIIAAMYLDAGLEQAKSFIMSRVLKDAEISEEHRSQDYKTVLQELVQRKADQHIAYELIGESGPDHNKRFTFRVSINGVSAGEGTGRTKKEAEQMAAKQALETLQA